MGLYLCVFDGDEELEGVEVGRYGDFGWFRDTVRDQLEGRVAGARFPTLMLHSDCDGSWSPSEAATLRKELQALSAALAKLPPVPLPADDWQTTIAAERSLAPKSLLDCFFDVDGEPLLTRLMGLCDVAIERRLPILFQ